MFMNHLGHEGFKVSSIVFDIENYLKYKSSINSQKVFSEMIKQDWRLGFRYSLLVEGWKPNLT